MNADAEILLGALMELFGVNRLEFTYAELTAARRAVVEQDPLRLVVTARLRPQVMVVEMPARSEGVES